MGLALVVGTAFVIASLPDGTATLASRDGWDWLAVPSQGSTLLDKQLKAHLDFQVLLTWIGYALIAYLGGLSLVLLRHRRPRLLAVGVGVLVLSAVVLHLLAWVGVIVFTVGAFVVRVYSAFTGLFASDGEPEDDWSIIELVKPVVALFEPYFGGWAWVPAAAIPLVVLLAAFLWGPEWMRFTAGFVAGVAALIAGLAGVFWLFGLIPASFLSTAGAVLFAVVGVVVVVLVLTTVGQLFLDQMRSTMIAGSGGRGVMMGAIAVGSTIALFMLVGNVHDVYDFYPPKIAEWARTTVLSKGNPLFDGCVSLVVVGLSAFGVLTNLGRMREEPDKDQFRKSLIYTLMGGIAGGAISTVSRSTSQD